MSVLSETRESAVLVRDHCPSSNSQYGFHARNSLEGDGQEPLPSTLLLASIHRRKKLVAAKYDPDSLDKLDETVTLVGDYDRSGDEGDLSISSHPIATSTGHSVSANRQSHHLIDNMQALDNFSSQASIGPVGSFTRSIRSSKSKRSGSSQSRKARYTLEQVIQATIIGASVHDDNQSQHDALSPQVSTEFILNDLVQASFILQHEFTEMMREPSHKSAGKFHLRPRFNPLLPSIASGTGTQASEDGSESLYLNDRVHKSHSYASSQPWDEPFPVLGDATLDLATKKTSLKISIATGSYKYHYDPLTQFVPIAASTSSDRFSYDDVRQTASNPESYSTDLFESDGLTSFPSDGWTSFDGNNPFMGQPAYDSQKSPIGVTDIPYTRNWKTSDAGGTIAANQSQYLI
jgi:hypothetical protein